jgi:hypothetical protein
VWGVCCVDKLEKESRKKGGGVVKISVWVVSLSVILMCVCGTCGVVLWPFFSRYVKDHAQPSVLPVVGVVHQNTHTHTHTHTPHHHHHHGHQQFFVQHKGDPHPVPQTSPFLFVTSDALSTLFRESQGCVCKQPNAETFVTVPNAQGGGACLVSKNYRKESPRGAHTHIYTQYQSTCPPHHPILSSLLRVSQCQALFQNRI